MARIDEDGVPLISASSSSVFGGEPQLPVAPRMSLGSFLNTHKRKLIVGGVIGGAAIAGTVGGILASKRRKTIQAAEPKGMFEKLSSGPVSRGVGGGGGGGGGSIGGGGFARYNQIQGAIRRYKRRGGKKRGGKRKSRKSRKSRKTHKKSKKGVRHGRIRKSKAKKVFHSMNKKAKKFRRRNRRKTAF